MNARLSTGSREMNDATDKSLEQEPQLDERLEKRTIGNRVASVLVLSFAYGIGPSICNTTNQEVASRGASRMAAFFPGIIVAAVIGGSVGFVSHVVIDFFARRLKAGEKTLTRT